ncbi:hypothetical protein Clacol_005764 [Clathrus columnatus]|uniref:Malate dehydrogenase n=1 Tax=Clathrus columnatus TaxID=1419009 RepID=A0AAV5AEX8_9AGAM|nr:hypothetical protein Clacol_005764 [Clathrus columnatus]
MRFSSFKFASLTPFIIFAFTSATPSLQRSFAGCNVSQAVIPIGQSGLTVAPAGQKPINIALGVGTQNYTCSASGTFASIGAVATLFDASCIFEVIDDLTIKTITPLEIAIDILQTALGKSPTILGHHFFIDNPTGAVGVSPTFDFRSNSERGNPEAFVVTSKSEDVKSPNNPTHNVDWLQLIAIPGQGELASTIYRILTLGGQPPASCAPGCAPITVPYAANYWFFK